MTRTSKIAIDIQDLSDGVILDGLLEKGEVFRTAKHRKAILIGKAQIEELKRRYSLLLEESTDGLSIIKD